MRIRNSLKYKVSDKRGSEEDEDVHVDLYGAEPTTGEVVDVDEAIRPAVPKLLEAMRSDNKMLYECALALGAPRCSPPAAHGALPDFGS